jgi:LemA protein
MKWVGIGVLAAVVIFAVMGVGSYNELVRLDQSVQSQWGQVESVYQRRLDLIPNLVETVKGAANFEQETLSAVSEARAKAGQTVVQAGRDVIDNPDAFKKFEDAQQNLSGALSRLLVTVERYPELKATQGFRDLQAQLEGTENRISVERMRFNEAAQAFNTRRNSFPTAMIAGFFGSRFNEKSYFRSQQGADTAPKVKF